MELEFKHLAAYLEHGIQVSINGNIQTMNSLYSAAKLVCYGWGNAGFIWKDNIKPILRPLSDLTKEITVNGETFVPMNVISREFEMDVVEHCYIEQNFYPEYIKKIRFEVVQKLLEWHFDIFGLIPAGLAIDINTLNE